MNTRIVATAAGFAVALVAGGAALASASGGTAGGSRLDDGKDLLSQSGITERQAIDAARGAASGGLNEADLEHAGGRLVWNVDVGDRDVKVDASTGDVVAVDHDD